MARQKPLKCRAKRCPKGWSVVVLYVRMSSRKQTESPERQRADLERYCEAQKLWIRREYTDLAVTGDSVKLRPGFSDLLAQAEAGADFESIVCFDKSRFGRWAPLKAMSVINQFFSHGVFYLRTPAKEYDFRRKEHQLYFFIESDSDHEHIVKIAQHSTSGKRYAAESGKGSGRPPYGYDRGYFDASGKLVKRVPFGERYIVSPSETWTLRFLKNDDAKTVKRIFRLYLDGVGYAGIARQLNQDDIPTARGARWTNRKIRAILENERYRGASVIGQYECAKFASIANGVKTDGARVKVSEVSGRPRLTETGKPIIVENAHDRIISDADFRAVQRLRDARPRKDSRDRGTDYILSGGVMVCAACASNMVGHTHKKRGKRVYRCAGAVNGRTKCNAITIDADVLEPHILGVIRKWVFTDQFFARVRERVYQIVTAEAQTDSKRQKVQSQLATIRRNLDKCQADIATAEDEDERQMFIDLTRNLRRKRKELEAQLDGFVEAPGGMTPEEQADAAVDELRRIERLARSKTIDQRRRLIQTIIDRITIKFDPSAPIGHRFVEGKIAFRTAPLVTERSDDWLLSILANILEIPTFSFTAADLFAAA